MNIEPVNKLSSFSIVSGVPCMVINDDVISTGMLFFVRSFANSPAEFKNFNLNFKNIKFIKKRKYVDTVHVGHFIISEAIFISLTKTINIFRNLIKK